MYGSRVNLDTRLFRILLLKSVKYPVWGRKTIHAMKNRDFDKKTGYDFSGGFTGRVFSSVKQQYTDWKLIYPIKSKMGDKSPYAISPLGIAYYCNNAEEINREEAHSILQVFKEMNVPTISIKQWKELEKIMPPDRVLDLFQRSCQNIDISKSKTGNILVDCNYHQYVGSTLNLSNYLIVKNDKDDEFHIEDWSFVGHFVSHQPTITSELFFKIIAQLIYYSFLYVIVEFYRDRIIFLKDSDKSEAEDWRDTRYYKTLEDEIMDLEEKQKKIPKWVLDEAYKFQTKYVIKNIENELTRCNKIREIFPQSYA